MLPFLSTVVCPCTHGLLLYLPALSRNPGFLVCFEDMACAALPLHCAFAGEALLVSMLSAPISLSCRPISLSLARAPPQLKLGKGCQVIAELLCTRRWCAKTSTGRKHTLKAA